LAYGKIADEYRKNAVNGASPLQLIVMLYDGALRFMEAGKDAMKKRDLPRQNENLQKAQRILMELMSCLDMEKGGEIAQNLLALYAYSLDELVQANVTDDPEGVERAAKVLSDLRQSWVQLDQMTRRPAEDQPLAA
jgi:flagellar secretion chaperone FliS